MRVPGRSGMYGARVVVWVALTPDVQRATQSML